MRHLSTATLIAVAAWLAAASPASADAIFSIDAPPAAIGDSLLVNADITGVTDLYAFQFDLSFDPAILAATSSFEGPFLLGQGPTFFINGVIDNTAGSVAGTADTLLTAISGVTGDGTLAYLGFDAIGPGTSALTLSNIILLDSNLNDIPFTIANGSITVEGGGTSPVPEPGSAVLLAMALLASLLGGLSTVMGKRLTLEKVMLALGTDVIARRSLPDPRE